jgi:hypothetical protein
MPSRWYASPALWLAALFFFIAAATVSPNPFGNNPDAIGDESYFLTSALSALEHHTLPGWDFSVGGNYYGGVETYLDTALIVPVIGVSLAQHHFSLLDTEGWIATHTGDPLALLRFVNGALVLIAVGALCIFFRKRRIPAALALQLLCVLFLLLGNSLVAQFVHTAKVWVIYLILDAGIGALFVAQEYYLSRGEEPLVSRRTEVALMAWAGVLAFFQNYVGVFPIALWAGYALLLGHFSWREVLAWLRRSWYLVAALALTQVSFFWRILTLKYHGGSDPWELSATTARGGIDWLHRLLNPLYFALMSQPLLIFYVVGAIVACVLWRRADGRTRRYLTVACAHPVLVYLFFHVLLGFSLFPRYALPLTVALSFSAVMLIAQSKALLRAGVAFAAVLFVVVSIHSITLYWRPSSEAILTNMLEASYNSPHNVFIFETFLPQASRLTLPLNSASLSLLNTRHQSMSRYQFLLQHPGMVDRFVSFKPVALIPDTASEEAAYRARFSEPAYAVWAVSSDCTAQCSTAELQSGSCFELNFAACGGTPQEINTLPDFLSFTELGSAYIVRRIR